MDAHWLRLHHGTYTDPKWRVVVTRCHAMSRQVTTATVLAVWMCMLETASQAEDRGTLDGWCHEDVAAALGIAEEDVAAIYEAMQGKTLDGNRLLAWEKRQPKREREDATAADRKRAQREREAADRGVTGRDKGMSRHVTPRGEERRREEKQADTPRSVDSSPLSASERARDDDFGGHDRDQVPEAGREFELLDDHDQDAVRPYVATLLPELKVPLQLLADLVKHLRVIGKPMSISMWKLFLGDAIALRALGGSVPDAIRRTIQAGNCARLITDSGPRAGPPKPSVADSFKHKTYTGTPDDELPDFLRANPAA